MFKDIDQLQAVFRGWIRMDLNMEWIPGYVSGLSSWAVIKTEESFQGPPGIVRPSGSIWSGSVVLMRITGQSVCMEAAAYLMNTQPWLGA